MKKELELYIGTEPPGVCIPRYAFVLDGQVIGSGNLASGDTFDYYLDICDRASAIMKDRSLLDAFRIVNDGLIPLKDGKSSFAVKPLSEKTVASIENKLRDRLSGRRSNPFTSTGISYDEPIIR